MSALVAGCDTVAVSLNKAIGAPLGSVLAGSHAAIDEALRLRDALGGGWRPIGSVAAASRAALEGWRHRLETDTGFARKLGEGLSDRLGGDAVQPVQTNLIFLNRARGDAALFIDILKRHGVEAIGLTSRLVRLAIHSGVRDGEVETIVAAVATADIEAAACA